MAKTAIFLAEGFEEIEALTVVDLLRRAGIEITTASITGSRQVCGSHGIKVEADALFEGINFDDTDMIILPGGMPGTDNLDACEPLKARIREFADAGKKLSAICAAPRVLGKMGVLSGKKHCSTRSDDTTLRACDVSPVILRQQRVEIGVIPIYASLEFVFVKHVMSPSL